MDDWGENQKMPKPNNQHCLTLHPWMSKETPKRAWTEQPKLSNIAEMDEWGENQKGFNGTTKIV
jgi:hypothetical protein